MKCLLVFPLSDQPLALTLQEELYEKLDGLEPNIQIASNGQDAKSRLNMSGPEYDTVITALDIPESRTDPDVSGGGLSLLRWIRRRGLKARVAIVVPVLRRDLQNELIELRDCTQLSQEDVDNWIDQLIRFVRDGVPPRNPVLITIDFSPPPSEWTYKITSDSAYVREGKIKAQGAFLQLAKTLTANVIELPVVWPGQLKSLGESLGTLLFSDNARFQNDLNDALGVGGRTATTRKETRVVFRVDKNVYPILLEAISHPHEKDPHYWMLHAPVIRSIRSDIAPLELRGGAPPKCLIIEANATGIYDAFDIPNVGRIRANPPVNLRALPFVKKECEMVERIFQGMYDQKLVKQVLRLRPVRGASLWDQFQKAMKETQWDIVHFAGHSSYQQENGFIFFPAE